MSANGGMSVPVKPIVFFDGVCGLCNATVDLLLRIDTRQIFLFAPLQGETARRALGVPPADASEWSILLLDERGLHQRSDAALEICRRLGWPWALLGLLRWVPRGLRDAGYRVIARNRYRWFGRHETCRVPTPEERERFLP